MKNLKTKLVNWLLKETIDELEEKINKKAEELKLTEKQYNRLVNQNKSLIAEQHNALDMVKDISKTIGVGVDVNQYSPSWAVVCIQGKTDFIKFINLGERDLRQIKDFLMNFDRRNVNADLPMGMTKRRFFEL